MMYGEEYLKAKDKAEAIKRATEAVDAILSEYEDIDAREAIAMRICPGVDTAKKQRIADELLRQRNAYNPGPYYSALAAQRGGGLLGAFSPFR